jgi:hypothetical protein
MSNEQPQDVDHNVLTLNSISTESWGEGGGKKVEPGQQRDHTNCHGEKHVFFDSEPAEVFGGGDGGNGGDKSDGSDGSISFLDRIRFDNPINLDKSMIIRVETKFPRYEL